MILSRHTYYGFKLDDGIAGLKRALTDAHVHIHQLQFADDKAEFKISVDNIDGDIKLEYSQTDNHPLARLGSISVIEVHVSENLPDIKSILTLAFLRGGG